METAPPASFGSTFDAGVVAFILRLSCWKQLSCDLLSLPYRRRPEGKLDTCSFPMQLASRSMNAALCELHLSDTNNAVLRGCIPCSSCNALRSVHISVRPEQHRGLDVPRGVRAPLCTGSTRLIEAPGLYTRFQFGKKYSYSHGDRSDCSRPDVLRCRYCMSQRHYCNGPCTPLKMRL